MKEITLYDPEGNHVAYIARDKEETIYLWSGNPVAYLRAEHIYSFSGKHLGWFEDGIIWDHQGAMVGFTAGALPFFPKFEDFKGFKQFKPFKGFEEYAPFKPFKSTNMSLTPLLVLLSS